MRKWFVALLCLLLPFTASATILGVQQGGTGSSTLSGILIGNGINPVNTLTVGSGLTLTGTTLTSTGGGGTPGGLNLQVQYNNAGSFGGISGAVTNGTILNLTNPLLGGATLTTSVVNGVTLTAAGSATTYLNGTGAYTTPVGTVYTGTFPVSVSGTVISFGGLATSTAAILGNIPYFSGVNTFANVATGTISNGTGISVTAGQSVIGSGLTITNSGVTSIVAGTNVTISGATGAVTINATGGSSFAFPFTPTNNFGVNTNATSTTLSLFAGLNASSTSHIASTTFDVTGFVGIGTSTNSYGSSKFATVISNAVASLGGLLINTATNVTNAFSIVNAAGATVFNVDTTISNPFVGIGTTTPWATLSAVGDGVDPVFAVSTSTSNNVKPNFEIDQNGHLITSGLKPTCTTSCTFGQGNDNYFRITTGSTVSSEVVTFAKSWGTLAPICQATEGNNTVSPIVIAASSTPTTVTLTNASLSAKDIDVSCVGIQ